MTHDEAVELLPSYALGSLEDAAELERHLSSCAICPGLLAEYLETAARLGEAVEPSEPPYTLRDRIRSGSPAAGVIRTGEPADSAGSPSSRLHRLSAGESGASAPGRGESAGDPAARGVTRPSGAARFRRWISRPAIGAGIAAALLLAALGTAYLQQQELTRQRQELALDERGLALLTSTETTIERLNPVAGLPSLAHGHWYHRDGVPTQVVVVEFLPAAPPGTEYVGWLRHADGRWQSTGAFSLDANGYGRLIVLGSDGGDVREVLITRQRGASGTPSGERILDWIKA